MLAGTIPVWVAECECPLRFVYIASAHPECVLSGPPDSVLGCDDTHGCTAGTTLRYESFDNSFLKAAGQTCVSVRKWGMTEQILPLIITCGRRGKDIQQPVTQPTAIPGHRERDGERETHSKVGTAHEKRTTS